MAKKQEKNYALPFLRIALGVVFLYAGLSKVINPDWSAAGFLANANTFPAFYGWLGSQFNIEWVNFLNQWGLTLVGAGLVLGAVTRYAAYGGMLMMVLYYFPSLDFPMAGEHAFLVDEHIVYIAALAVLVKYQAGQVWGLDKSLSKKWKWLK